MLMVIVSNLCFMFKGCPHGQRGRGGKGQRDGGRVG